MPIAPVTASVTQPICGNPSTYGYITVTGPLGPSYTYSINGINFQSSPEFSSIYLSGSFTVYAKDAVTLETSSLSNLIISQSIPALPVATVTQPNCVTSVGAITLSKSHGYSSSFSYTASQISGGTASYSNTNAIFTNIPASSLWGLTVTDGNGCVSPNLTVSVNAAPAQYTGSVGPVTSSILTNLTASIYQGQTTSLSLGTVPSASYYRWTPGNLSGSYILSSSTYIGTVDPIINLTGSVINTSTLIVTPINVCAASSSTALITVNAIPIPIGIVTPVTYTQNDPSVPLIATASLTGSSLQWYTTGSGGVGTPTAPTPSTSISGTQTYYVTTFLNSYESSRAPVVVQVSSAPTPIPTTTPSPTQTPIPTSTPTPTVTGTPTPTSTNTPTPTPSPTQTPIPTSTPVPTGTPTPSPTQTPIPTSTPVPTGTPTPSPTVTPTPTAAPISPATTAVPYNLGLTAETTIYVNEVKCRVLENDFNYSQNPTVFKYITRITGSRALPFYSSSVGIITDGTIADNLTGSYFNPYVTTVGLYNEFNDLLVVGKLATPYPIPENTDITFIVRWDS